MTVSAADLALYAGALFILFMTPGPVWIALVARALSGGFAAAWPLALGVAIGDVFWPLLAIFGVTLLASVYEDVLTVLRIGGAILFTVMGVLLIRHADSSIAENPRLTRPGLWAGFSAGLLVILGNPKAILFYMGLLPTFFDMTALTTADIVAVCLLSAIVPFVGNVLLALLVGRIRALLQSPKALRRANQSAGGLLIGVGALILLS
ncbi:MAG: LysE family translocator [Pseudomonadota bacterium]